MYERSGAPSRSGVGTVMTATSKPREVGGIASSGGSPASSAAASCSSVTSSTYDCAGAQARRPASAAMSKPTTREADLGRAHRDRQPDVALPDDHDARHPVVERA